MVQLRTKIAQNRAQEPPTRHPKTQKYIKNALELFVCTLPQFLQTSPPRCRKRSELDPKSSSNIPSLTNLGAILGPIWQPNWANLAHFFVSRGWPRRPLSDFASRCRPQGPPDTRCFRFRASFFTIVWFISEVCFCKFVFYFEAVQSIP